MLRLPVISAALGMSAALFLSIGAAQAEAPRVVVSIKPIHSLVASVMKGVGQPFLLVKGNASPHNYALRPSEARRLANANIIVWVGEGLETFMTKPIETLGKKATIVELHDAKGIRLYKTREGGIWEGHDEASHDDHKGHGHKGHGHKGHGHKGHSHKGHGHKAHGKKSHSHKGHSHKGHSHKGHGHKDHGHAKHAHGGKKAAHDDHAHGENDMHLWLDTQNAKAIVRAVADALVKADAANAATYRKNAVATLKRLDALDKELRATLTPVRAKPYLVFHDAYQYLEKRYRLAAAGSVTVNPERRPGAKRVSALRKRIAKANIRCVFVEPQFPKRIVSSVVSGTKAKTGTLDPLGAKVPAGEGAYFAVMRKLASSLKGCLQ